MAINYSIEDTKLDDLATRKFDIKTKSTRQGKDIVFNSIGSVDRIIGLDKLKQQTEKALLVSKGTYSTSKELGTALLSSGRKDKVYITSDIKNSLTEYAAIQQQENKTKLSNVLGVNIYKTVDIKDTDSWKKINDNIIPINYYVDTDVAYNVIYYYAITTVYRDTTNRVKETQIAGYKDITITPYNNLVAKIDSDFTLISDNVLNTNTVYWNTIVELTQEEQLRSILSIDTVETFGDPRGMDVAVSLTNREITALKLVV